jgi:hypothetical protein
MASARGCLKATAIGCGSIIVLSGIAMAVFIAIATSGGGENAADEVRRTVAGLEQAESVAVADPAALTALHPGRIVLDLAHGEFNVKPAGAGEGLSLDATYDPEIYTLAQQYVVAPDSSWTAYVSLRRSVPALVALVRYIGGNDTDASITVRLPAEVPIELVASFEQGGGEIDLGGLWLTTADFTVRQGGFEMSCPEPLREPAARVRLHSRMGGVAVADVGNLSPRELVVDCGMGGADISLDGLWRNDCAAVFRARMGGMAVGVPKGLDLAAGGSLPQGLELPAMRRTDVEVPLPVMTVHVETRWAEIEFGR